MNLETVLNRQEQLNSRLEETVILARQLNNHLLGENETCIKSDDQPYPSGLVNQLDHLQNIYQEKIIALEVFLKGIQRATINVQELDTHECGAKLTY